MAMDETSSSPPENGLSIIIAKHEDSATSSLLKRSRSLIEIRKGITDKNQPLEQRIQMFSPALILKNLSDELEDISFSTSSLKESLPEVIKKGIWAISFFHHMTGELLIKEGNGFCESLEKIVTSQPSPSQTSSSEPEKGNKNNEKDSQESPSTPKNPSNPFDKFTEFLNGEQKKSLGQLRDSLSVNGILSVKKKRDLVDALKRAFFNKSVKKKDIEEEFSQFTTEILITSALARGNQTKINKEVFSKGMTMNVIGRDVRFYRLSVLFGALSRDYNSEDYLEIAQRNDVNVRALEIFLKNVNLPETNYRLAVMYSNGHIGQLANGNPNYREAERWLRESGIPDAKCYLGYLNMKGLLQGGHPNLKEAERLFREANTPEAKYCLGVMYLRGYIGQLENDEPNYGEAEQWFTKTNIPEAYQALGLMYAQGLLGRQTNDQPDYKKARSYLLVAFLNGLKETQAFLSKLNELEDLQQKISVSSEEISSSEEIENSTAADLKAEDAPAEDNQIVERISLPIRAASSNEASGFYEAKTPEPRTVPYQKQKTKKLSREQRIQQLKEELAKEKMSTVGLSLERLNKPQTFEVAFESSDVENAFHIMMSSHKKDTRKIKELMKDIMLKPWGTEGSGQPERLKGTKNEWSRRLNHKDRLVYRVELGKVTILSCEGHYDD